MLFYIQILNKTFFSLEQKCKKSNSTFFLLLSYSTTCMKRRTQHNNMFCRLFIVEKSAPPATCSIHFQCCCCLEINPFRIFKHTMNGTQHLLSYFPCLFQLTFPYFSFLFNMAGGSCLFVCLFITALCFFFLTQQ